MHLEGMRYKMRKIYDKLPIELWKDLAYRIQRLKFVEASDDEFNRNLVNLQELLSDLRICTEGKKREPKDYKDVGLATLLHSIYSIDVMNRCKKAMFYEKIYELADLGVKNIQYRPVNFYDSVNKAFRTIPDYHNNETTILKTYTDGIFDLVQHANSSGYWKNINNLRDASYLMQLKTILYNEKQVLVYCDAYLKDFDAILPNSNTILTDVYPEVYVPSQTITTDGTIKNVTLGYERFDSDSVSCAKRLTRTEKGEFYYREFRK